MGCTRVVERAGVAMGLLDEAPARFEHARDVPGAGVLCALPALLAGGLLKYAGEMFSLPKGFYGVAQIFILMGFMALSRIKSMEQLRYCPPGEWGKLLGLDRIPEVRTMRSKVKHLAETGDVEQWGLKLSKDWMEADPESAGLLYVDGHIRVYHGCQTKLPARYAAREKLCLRGMTDYWVNDQTGRPFFVITCEAFFWKFVSNLRSLLVNIPTSLSPFVMGTPEILYFLIISSAFAIFSSG